MKNLLAVPTALLMISCSGSEEVASGTFDDGDGGKGSYSITGKGEDSETVIKSGDGEVRIATGANAVEDLPMGIEIYPGAEVQTSMTGIGDGKSGAMIVFTSSDDQDDVVSFYKKQLKSKGIEINAEVKAGDMQMIGGERGDGEGINVSVTKTDDGQVTTTLIAGGKN